MNYINEHDLLQKIRVCRATIHRWRKKNGFPAPVHIGGVKKNLWDEKQVDQWLSENISEAV